jgi:AbrB family looped-hinge helix DNA binding protein
LGEARPKQIIEWIRQHYPDEQVNDQSYRGDLMANSINHPSEHHFAGAEKFLWFNKDNKTYRIADPSELNTIEEHKISQSSTNEKTLLGKIGGSGQVIIPPKIREKMGFNAGDLVAFVINEQGVLELRKARMKVEIL